MNKKKRFLLDTNVLLTGFFDNKSTSALLRNTDLVQFYGTENIYNECKKVIRNNCKTTFLENSLLSEFNRYIDSKGFVLLSSNLPNFVFGKQRNDIKIKYDVKHHGLDGVITYNLKDFEDVNSYTPEYVFGRYLRDVVAKPGLKGFFGSLQFGGEWTMIHIGNFYNLEKIIHGDKTKIIRNKDSYFEIIKGDYRKVSTIKFKDGKDYSFVIEYKDTPKVTIYICELNITERGIHLNKKLFLEANIEMKNPKMDMFFARDHQLSANTEYFSVIPRILNNNQLKICLEKKSTDHLQFSLDVGRTINSAILIGNRFSITPYYWSL